MTDRSARRNGNPVDRVASVMDMCCSQFRRLEFQDEARADSVSGEDSLVHRLPSSHCVLVCGRGENVLWSLSYKGTNPVHEGSTPMISSLRSPFF